MKKLNAALLILALALLVYTFWNIGPQALWNEVRALRWGVIPLTLSEGLANLAHTIGWRHCIANDRPPVSLTRLFRLMMAGFAVNYLTPTASVGGEVSKAALLTSNCTGAEAVSSVMMDKLCLGVAHLLITTLGCIFLLCQLTLPVQLWVAMAVTIGLLAAGMVTFLLMQKLGKVGGLVKWLVDHKVGGRPLQQAAGRISEVDKTLILFYRERPLDLLLSITWHLLGHSVAILQVWLFLFLIGQSVSYTAVLTAAFLGLWSDLLTFAVPLNLGALEGSRIVALKAIGYGAASGMALGVAMRIAQVFWALFGLLNYGLLSQANGFSWKNLCKTTGSENDGVRP